MKTINHKFWYAIADTVDSGIYVVDKDMRIVYINSAAQKIMGLTDSVDSILGQYCHDYSKGNLCGRTAILCETLREGKETDNYHFTFRSKDFVRNVVLTSRRICDDSGEIIGAFLIIKKRTLGKDNSTKRQSVKGLSALIGAASVMQDMYDMIMRVAKTDSTVLLMGESGTGKELVADAVHALSNRDKGPLIKVNCSALSPHLLESELFGHLKGSFTGAIKDKIGKFELAHGGTIFLDEIGELDTNLQIKLLRVLQEREIEKVGENKTKKIDCRIVAATNADLKQKIKDNLFREDLYYRLNVFPIIVPPLRERLEDIDILAEAFLKKAAKKGIDSDLFISDMVLEKLKHYDWPGNVRELEHAIEYSAINAKNNIIDVEDLPADIKYSIVSRESTRNQAFMEMERDFGIDRDVIVKTLEDAGWNKTNAAKKLNIGRTTLWRLMKKYYIQDPSH